MNIRLIPDKLTGSRREYPYLARLIKEFKDFSTVIVLVEKGKQTVVVGRYRGDITRHRSTYANGAILYNGTLIHPSNLVPLNKERA